MNLLLFPFLFFFSAHARYYAFDDDLVRSTWHNYEHRDDEFLQEYREQHRDEWRGNGRKNAIKLPHTDGDDEEEVQKRCRRTAEHRMSYPTCNSFHEMSLIASNVKYIT